MYTISARISFKVRKPDCDYDDIRSLNQWMNEVLGAAHADVRRRLQEHGFLIETEAVRIYLPEE